MNDTIDREQAITELQMSAKRLTLAYEAHGEGRVEYSEYVIRVSDAKEILLTLPSIQPKPLKYSGTSICCYCETTDCDGCLYEPMTDRCEE